MPIQDNTLIVYSVNGGALIKGGLHTRLLLHLAATPCPASALMVTFMNQALPHQIMAALTELQQRGYIVEAGHEQSQAQPETETEPGAAQPAGTQYNITVQAMGQVPLVPFYAACQQANIGTEGAPALQVVVCADYDFEQLQAINKQALAQQQPWLLVRPTGNQPLVGPLFLPGQTACWQCYQHRIELNQPYRKIYSQATGQPYLPPAPGTYHPQLLQAAYHLAATQIAAYLGGAAPSPLINGVLAVNATPSEPERHHLVQRPQCPACGQPANSQAVPMPVSQGTAMQQHAVHTNNGYRVLPPQVTFNTYKHHISPITGVVPQVAPYGNFNNETIHNYTAGTNLMAAGSLNLAGITEGAFLKAHNGGKGKNVAQAKTSALCEALERYSMAYHGQPNAIYGSLNEVPNALHPNECMLYSPAQYKQGTASRREGLTTPMPQAVPEPFNPAQPLGWTALQPLVGQHVRYLPTAFCYAQHPSQLTQQAFTYPDSNGCAAGNTLQEAILQGFLELAERDAAAIWWYNRLQRPAVQLQSVPSTYVQRVAAMFASKGRTLTVLDLTHDLNIPVFAAVSYQNNPNQSHEILYAFGAHVNACIAIERALTELNQALPLANNNTEASRSAARQAINQWLAHACIEQHPYLTPFTGPPKIFAKSYSTLCGPSVPAALHYCLAQARQLGLEVLVLNLTQPDVGLPVVRVIVPGLRHFWRRTAPGRLYQVPVKLGWRTTPLTEKQLNPNSIFL